eukprot:6480552-Pyramimonas_sp.AAC.1
MVHPGLGSGSSWFKLVHPGSEWFILVWEWFRMVHPGLGVVHPGLKWFILVWSGSSRKYNDKPEMYKFTPYSDNARLVCAQP